MCVSTRRASRRIVRPPASKLSLLSLVYSLSPRSSLRRRSSSGSPPPTSGRRLMPTRFRRQPHRRLDVLHERRGHTHRTPARALGAVRGRAPGKESSLPCLNLVTILLIAVHVKYSWTSINGLKYDSFCPYSRPILLVRQNNSTLLMNKPRFLLIIPVLDGQSAQLA